ncbi:hypothetical protein MBLNU457_2236t1 [Dothideomycetes sp. NU457]
MHPVGSSFSRLRPSTLRKPDTNKDVPPLPAQVHHDQQHDHPRDTHTADGTPRLLYTKKSLNSHNRDRSKGGESDRHFTIANVGSHGTIYLRYDERDDQNEDAYEQVLNLNDRPSIPNTEPTFTSNPSASGSSSSPPKTSTANTTDASAHWHDRLHASAAAASIAAHFEEYAKSEDIFAPGQYYGPNESIPFVPLVPTPPHTNEPTLLQPTSARRDSQSSRKDSAHGEQDLLRIPIPDYRIVKDSRESVDFSHLKLDDLVFPSPPIRSPPIRSPPIKQSKPSPPLLKLQEPSPATTPSTTPKQDDFPIGPEVYDSFVEDSENSRYIRYLPGGQLMAATPARLIAQVTHVQLLDYELLSDFFLTYRAFIAPTVLLRYLVARLRWAVFRGGQGRVVRVRTFVAMRHWILNYFMDDFEPDYHLRLLFCELVNALATDVYARSGSGAGDLQVIGELKKCWRRTCDVVWSSNDSGPEVTAIDDIIPHGESTTVEKSYPITSAGPTPTGEKPLPSRPAANLLRKPLGIQQRQRLASLDPTNIATFVLAKNSPGAIYPLRKDSYDVTSCSIPMWRHLERAAPSFKPKTVTPLEGSEIFPYTGKDLTFVNEQTNGVGANNSTETVHQHQVSRKPVPKDLRRFRSGDLIRGLLVPPPTPTVRKQFATGPFVSNTVRIEGNAGGQTSKPPSRIASQMKRKLSMKKHERLDRNERNETSEDQDFMGALQLRPDTGYGTQAMIPIKYVVLSCPDRLAARVSEAYDRLAQDQDQSSLQNSRPPSRHGFPEDHALGTTGHDWSKGKDLPIGFRDLRGHNKHMTRMTTSSQSIFIVDDTGERNYPPVDSDLHDKLTPQRFHPVSGYFAMQPEASSDYYGSSSGDVPPMPTLREASPFRVEHAMKTLEHRPSETSDVGDLLPHALGVLPDDDELTEKGTIRGSSEIDPFDAPEVAVGKPNMLHRKPGGLLKGVGKMTELAVPRRNSTGTIASFTRSRGTSATVSTEIFDAQVASVLGQPRLVGRQSSSVEQPPRLKRSLSLLSTHSSQPNLRPSFEAEVQRLKKLETEALDDGGIDATLARLEGREPSNPNSPVTPTGAATARPRHIITAISKSPERKAVKVLGHPDHPQTSRLDMGNTDWSPVPAPSRGPAVPAKGLAPLVFEDVAKSTTPDGDATAGAQDSYIHSPTPRRSESLRKNWPLVQSMEANSQPSSPARVPSVGTTQQSFLLDDDEPVRGGANQGPVDTLQTVTRDVKTPNTTSAPSTADRSFFFDDDDADDVEDNRKSIPVTPMKGTPVVYAPPTSPPPSTPLPAIPFTAPLHNPMPEKAAKRLRTPGPPTTHQPVKPVDSFPLPPPPRFNYACPTDKPGLDANRPIEKEHKQSLSLSKPVPPLPLAIAKKSPNQTHTPFVLAFSSELLAQQFTVIEKDALAEIDWKELIDLKWASTPPKVRNWADYCMRTPNQSGVDIVIARFNLVVKWAVSSVLMCDTAAERARTIAKYIHIAAHCRRLRNYATTYQLTVALLSTAISRLSSTWTLVADSDRAALSDLAELVQPVKNFARLRSEMETSLVSNPASQTAPGHARTHSKGEEDGYGACIPFLGIYTHDLAFNAQRPAFLDANEGSPLSAHQVESSPSLSSAGHVREGSRNASNASVFTTPRTQEPPVPMIHWDRFQKAAGIVKGLLRLLEASSRYTIVPERELAGRCLWLAALSDEEIESMSRGLEK